MRPVYAPAMVAFVGGGGFGAAVGWFPLGPREVWVPSYHVSAGYMTRVNVSNTVVTEVNVRNVYTNVYVNKTVVNNIYVNQRVPGAVVAVRGDAMMGGRHIDASVAVRVPPAAMEHAQVMHAAPMAPERNAVLGGRAPVMKATICPPPASMTRPVVAKAPPPPAPVPFVRQQEALKANPGRPLDAREVRGMQPVVRPNIRLAAPVNAAPRPETIAPRNNPVLTPNPRRPDVRPEVPPPTVRQEDRREARPVTPVTPHPEVHPAPPPHEQKQRLLAMSSGRQRRSLRRRPTSRKNKGALPRRAGLMGSSIRDGFRVRNHSPTVR